jgi:hypothetical protein
MVVIFPPITVETVTIGRVEPSPAEPGAFADEPRGRGVTAAGAGALLLLTAVLWVVGGLKATADGPRQVKPGVAVDQGRFTVTVESARVGQVKEKLGSGRVSALIVRLNVVNNDKETASLSGDLGAGFAGEPRPGTYLEPTDIIGLAGGARTSVETGAVQPGLPVEAEAVWELKPGSAPEQITVALRRWEYGSGFTDLQKRWKVDKQAPMTARVTLAVTRP